MRCGVPVSIERLVGPFDYFAEGLVSYLARRKISAKSKDVGAKKMSDFFARILKGNVLRSYAVGSCFHCFFLMKFGFGSKYSINELELVSVCFH